MRNTTDFHQSACACNFDNIGNMVQIEGSYKHEKSENFDEYLTAMEIPLVPRKMMTSTSPSIEISKNGDEWTLSFKVAVISNTVKFKMGEDFEEKEPMTGNVHKVSIYRMDT